MAGCIASSRAMPKPRPPHLERFKTRHGKLLWYFRVGKGPRTLLPEPYGSEAFWTTYHAALKAHQARKPEPDTKTLGWLLNQFEASQKYKDAAGETKKQLKYQFARMRERGANDVPLSVITAGRITANRDERAAKVSDANKYVKACRKLFAWAVEHGHMKSNPARDVALVAAKVREDGSEGFLTWTEDEAAAYEARWSVGTRERLAFDLLIYTGLRRSDIVRLGRQHVKNGVITIKTRKSVNSGRPVEVAVRLLPALARSIAATDTGILTFLRTMNRKDKNGSFTRESFGTWFKKACKAAGVNEAGKAAHGLRKIAAVRCAENGATELELNAMFGWRHGSKESARYVEMANRRRLGMAASDKLLPTPFPQTSPNLAEVIDFAGEK